MYRRPSDAGASVSGRLQPSYRPDKRNAVVFDSKAEFTIQDYVMAIADVVDAKDISHASKIQGKVCVYMKNSESANNLTKDEGITINGVWVNCRKYVNSASKLVISNVLPEITNDSLLTVLANYGKVTSEIRDLNIPIANTRPDLAHVKSFRRVVFILLNDKHKVPQMINLKLEGMQWTIYLTLDDACYRCKSTLHLARDCTQSSTETSVTKDRTGTSGSKTMAEMLPQPEILTVQSPIMIQKVMKFPH